MYVNVEHWFRSWVSDGRCRVGREIMGLDEAGPMQAHGCRTQPRLGTCVPRGRVPLLCSSSMFIHPPAYLELAELQALLWSWGHEAIFVLEM